MWPIKTYLDMADDTYTRGLGLSLEERRGWSRLEIRDSNTAGKDFLLLKVSFDGEKHPAFRHDGASIRLHKGQVKRIIKALQKFVTEAKGVRNAD